MHAYGIYAVTVTGLWEYDSGIICLPCRLKPSAEQQPRMPPQSTNTFIRQDNTTINMPRRWCLPHGQLAHTTSTHPGMCLLNLSSAAVVIPTPMVQIPVNYARDMFR
ncbi:hypothetical protein NP493_665g02004 [Ridgeia piscesae]|uniref:Uncharacterized protein n=1 Tax=Ridgeia piscesae TaxID=27915 RepID=A0AAD9NR35_RIDPI|nr:hypothetical protein NP493_665g02004 [Ridgeia piscesae]